MSHKFWFAVHKQFNKGLFLWNKYIYFQNFPLIILKFQKNIVRGVDEVCICGLIELVLLEQEDPKRDYPYFQKFFA